MIGVVLPKSNMAFHCNVFLNAMEHLGALHGEHFQFSQNNFDTFSHLLDNHFLEAVYHYSQGCTGSHILPVGDWMAEGYEWSTELTAS